MSATESKNLERKMQNFSISALAKPSISGRPGITQVGGKEISAIEQNKPSAPEEKPNGTQERNEGIPVTTKEVDMKTPSETPVSEFRHKSQKEPTMSKKGDAKEVNFNTPEYTKKVFPIHKTQFKHLVNLAVEIQSRRQRKKPRITVNSLLSIGSEVLTMIKFDPNNIEGHYDLRNRIMASFKKNIITAGDEPKQPEE